MLSDLVQEFVAAEKKYIVIDSAEELSGLERPEVFQEVLSTFKLAGWSIVFTTRLSYLEDLERTLILVYGVSFDAVNVESLTEGAGHLFWYIQICPSCQCSVAPASAKSVLSERISAALSKGQNRDRVFGI
jgi:hypothetical protein